MPENYDRDIIVGIWADGTISSWTRGDPKSKRLKHALPVASVDTVEQAESVQVRFGQLVPTGELKGEYVWTGWTSGDFESLPIVGVEIEEHYQKMSKGA